MRDDRVYLQHILGALRRIAEYTAGGRNDFFSTPLIQDGVVRNLEIIGEAVKNLSDALKAKQPTVPWKRIAGTRDKMIHEYFGVNLQLVWGMVEKDLPQLERETETILQALQCKA
jgi:uncharacterized protein with HEPN domain